MTDVGIKVEGATELRAALRQVDALLPRQIGVANKSAAEVVVREALPHVPYRRGKLRASIRALGSQRAGRVRAGGGQVAYAAAIHWGRKRGNVGSPPGNHPGTNPIVGRPFLTDAAQRSQTRVVHEYEQAIQRLIKGALQ